METMYYPLAGSTWPDSLKILEADIQHANALAAAIPRAKGGSYLQMKLIYNNLAPIFLFLLQWLDCSCSCILPRYFNPFHVLVYKVYTDGRPTVSTTNGRKATIMDFYAIILPSLQRLHGNLENSDDARYSSFESLPKNKMKRERSIANVDVEREDECGICLEPCTKMVLPNCCLA